MLHVSTEKNGADRRWCIANDPDDFYLFNVTRIINAVDMDRSKFEILPSGAIGECELLVFDPKKLTDALFFKNTQMGSHYDIFASETVVETVKRARLTGFEFTPDWTSRLRRRSRVGHAPRACRAVYTSHLLL